MNKVIKKICLLVVTGVIAICSIFAFNPSAVHADNIKDNACKGVNYALTGSGGEGCDETYNIESVWKWAYVVINWVVIIVGIISVVFIIIGAIKFQTSGGEPDKVKSGRRTLMFSIIGLVIAILAGVIVQVVFSVTSTLISTP